jgi:hypothetical protein
MLSALTRRTKLLLVAGAVALAVLVNLAWVAFGPEADRRGDLEAAVTRAWEESGAPVRDVSCSEEAGRWTCRIDQARGPDVRCSLGTPRPEVFVDARAALASGCGGS